MSFIFIDRRRASKGKSSSNRQRLIKRIKSYIKSSSPRNIGSGGVTGAGGNNSSPVTVASSALEEPWFAYASDGERTLVSIGNPGYDRGYTLPSEDDEESQSGGGSGGSGEDDFVVNVARDEFLDLFFEDCELPNLEHERYTEKLQNKQQHAGFSTSGSPAQLSIIRSYKASLARRRAMSAPHLEEIRQLEAEEAALLQSADSAVKTARLAEITARLEELRRHLKTLSGFDNTDLRYRKKEAQPLKTVDAVLIMVMDVSGSMTQEKKITARRWFALLYAFIKRRYANCELVFIAHTDEAFEMNEGDFFSTRIMGGTQVSPAIKLINQIIKERYDPSQTNIYVSHASDGDNWRDDNEDVISEMTGPGGLLSAVQFFSYVEVGKPLGGKWYSVVKGISTVASNSTLWDAYEDVQDRGADGKVSLSLIEGADDCYGVFQKVFKKRS
jgi:uncharacterized sporulation protein YeaH/YhbH (DUF444 family)